jgi:hypothetical protein
MKAVASYIKLQIDAAYVKLQALTTYQHLAIEVQYVLLKATAITGKFVEYIYVDDTITETDATTLAITKQLTDITELAEQISLGTTKALSDSAAMSDLFTLASTFNRDFADIASFSDVFSQSLDKPLADSMSDADAATLAVAKLIADSLAMADSVVGINFTDNEDDAVAIDDLGIDDDPAWNLGKNLADTASTTDAGLLIMQDYCDITYFLEDYVGQSRTF